MISSALKFSSWCLISESNAYASSVIVGSDTRALDQIVSCAVDVLTKLLASGLSIIRRVRVSIPVSDLVSLSLWS